MCLIVVAGCGGGRHGSGPQTFQDLNGWLKDAGECEGVEATLTHSAASPSRFGGRASADERFGRQAVASGLISCGGLNGYISYYRFASTADRVSAVRGRAGLISNELFCAKGSELVVNDLLGYDQTVGFCKRLGFAIHEPTHELSAAQEHEHLLEAKAARLVRHATNQPNVYCWHSRGRLRFECEEPTDGKLTNVELIRSKHRFVIRGCETPGVQRTENGSRDETCSFPTHAR